MINTMLSQDKQRTFVSQKPQKNKHVCSQGLEQYYTHTAEDGMEINSKIMCSKASKTVLK